MKIDLLAWLHAIPYYPKIYWASREGDCAMAGAGIASSSERQFGWRHFAPHNAPEWHDFAPNAFFYPRFVNHCDAHSSTKDQPVSYFYKTSGSLPTFEQWKKQIESALKNIRQNKFEKVVLARRVMMECRSLIDPIAICQSLAKKDQTVFLFQPTPASAFVGASPERLYRRRGRHIECDALAGTRPLHDNEDLLTCEKERREFMIVQNRIVEILSPLCHSPPIPSPLSLRSTPTVCHLYSQIQGDLKDGVTDDQLLDALHPTPAVGGYPSESALPYLLAAEPFSRGLYAAPIGWKSPDAAEFAVGIRSCLIQANRVYLFAGTGIVEGSDPLNEWKETEHKLSQWTSIFYEQQQMGSQLNRSAHPAGGG